MTFLPIVERELRVAARRPGTYRIRFYAVFLASLIVVWQMLDLLMGQPLPLSEQGRRLFHTEAFVAFMYCMLVGFQATADCLSEEKREETLGLLFLTGLRSHDIVLGKLVANSLSAVYGLLTVFPLLALPLLIGGVTAREFWLLALALLNMLFFSLATGMLVSSASRNARQATFAAAALVYAVAAAPLGATVFLDDPEIGIPLLAFSPAFAFGWIIMTAGRILPPNIPDLYWVSLGFCHLLSWLLLFRASAVLRRAWINQGSACRRNPLPEWIEQRSYGQGAERQQHRARLLDRNPFLWLAARDRWKPRYVWLLLVSVLVTWTYGYWRHGELMFDATVLLPAVWLFNAFIKVWMASEATTRLVNDHRSGALELLLSTPLSTTEIVRGQWLALRRQFTRPMAAVVVGESLLLLKILPAGPVAAIAAILIADSITVGLVGMWLAFRAKNPGKAVGTTLFLVLTCPWIVCLAGAQLIEWLGQSNFGAWLGQSNFGVAVRGVIAGLTNSDSAAGIPAWQIYGWAAVGLAFDLALGPAWARVRLRRDFRLAAVQRYFPERAH